MAHYKNKEKEMSPMDKNHKSENQKKKDSQISFDHGFLEKLAELTRRFDLSDVEVEMKDVKFRLSRHVSQQAPQVTHAFVEDRATPAPQKNISPAPAAQDDAKTIKSPMVGTVYVSPEPDAAPFVKLGDRVKEGQTLFIIEAMKILNHIPAPREGVIRAILVDNAQPVEYQEPLLILE